MRLHTRVVCCALVVAALATAGEGSAAPARGAAANARTPAVWCLEGFAIPPADHRFVARRRPEACVLEIVPRSGGISDPNPLCCVTNVYALRWSSWTATRAVAVGRFAPSIPAQGSRTHARVVLDRPRPGCLNGARAPVVFTRARIYPGVGSTAFYEQALPHNACVE